MATLTLTSAMLSRSSCARLRRQSRWRGSALVSAAPFQQFVLLFSPEFGAAFCATGVVHAAAPSCSLALFRFGADSVAALAFSSAPSVLLAILRLQICLQAAALAGLWRVVVCRCLCTGAAIRCAQWLSVLALSQFAAQTRRAICCWPPRYFAPEGAEAANAASADTGLATTTSHLVKVGVVPG